jgi:membrane protein
MPQDPPITHKASADEASISELVQQLSEQTSQLARQEIELAKAEMATKGKRLGIGAGAFGGAGLVALFGLGALTTALILLLATAMTTWLAALIVAAVYLAFAGILALVGKSKVQSATPPLPERAVASVKQDVEETKLRAKEGRA